MRRAVPILLCLILSLGGFCGALCFGQTAAHACCHEKDHCGHPTPTIQSHQAVASAQIVPVIPIAPPIAPGYRLAGFSSITTNRFTSFSPTLRTSVLRL